ncbi:GNAT family N-acetyltransferase [Thermoactinospora rubra]|uniref:GNAT family N-acetyltransferase n=1 Tax=Thermoactinospora rubra TaxID=1088767 RepID=UPI000A107F52|nr:GNAT family N-acetyltransferase [Thermoactinospora rubra]
MDITWGPLSRDDAEALAELYAAIEAEDRIDEHYSADDMAEYLADPLLDLAEGTLGAWHGTRLVAAGLLPCKQAADPAHLMVLGGGVHPQVRRQGYGRRILDWAIRTAPVLHDRRYPGRPLELHAGADDREKGKAALLESAGFTQVRWFFEMSADLAEARPRAAVPDGIRIVPWSPELDDGARAVRNLAFRDHWGSVPHTPESWRHALTGASSFRPESSFLALAGDRVVSILLTQYFEADTAATGVRDAYIAIIGTLREWRGRGVAGALIAHALTEFRRQGYGTASLGVDADNPTGAVGVYERAGFKVEHRGAVYALPLRGTSR